MSDVYGHSESEPGMVRAGDVLRIPQGVIGNQNAFRMRVEEVKRAEVRRDGRLYVQVYGVEVTKTGETRFYFGGRRYSEFNAWLGPDDYQTVSRVT